MFCAAETCNELAHAKGFCRNHYQRLTKYGRLEKIITGEKVKHHLFKMWNRRKQRKNAFVKEWLDFWTFVKDVGEPPTNSYLAKILKNEPCGPNNFYWKLIFKSLENETEKERRKRYWKENSLVNPDLYRIQNYKYNFKITLEEYTEKLQNQNNVCAICKCKETSKYKSTETVRNLAIDHNHKTGKIRDLLCSRCNLVLGRINEDVSLLENILVYLKKHES